MFPYLVALEGVLPGESLPTRLAEERFFSVVCVPVSLQVVLTIEGQSTHIACKGACRGSRILGLNVDRWLWNLRKLRLGMVVRQSGRLRPMRFGGAIIVVVVQMRVGHDRRRRLPGGGI